MDTKVDLMSQDYVIKFNVIDNPMVYRIFQNAVESFRSQYKSGTIDYNSVLQFFQEQCSMLNFVWEHEPDLTARYTATFPNELAYVLFTLKYA